MNTSASAACALLSMAAGVFHVHSWAGMANGNVAIQDLTPNSFAPPKIRSMDPAPKLLAVNNAGDGTLAAPKALGSDGYASPYPNTGFLQVAQGANSSSSKTVVLDSCRYMEPLETGGIPNSLSPLRSLKLYLRKIKVAIPEYIADAVVTVTKQPSFGRLVGAVSKHEEMEFTYVANDKRWLGKDRAEFEVNYQGKTYKIIMRIEMVGNVDLYHTPEDERACDPLPRRVAYETSVQTANGESAFDWDGVSAMLDSAAGRLDLSSIMLVFGDLANGAVGETTGEGANAQITLDTNAAGHGWYIDPTPLDNTDDFLPTSNPNIWQAKAGSEAEGKMDMLSVLLHEYGHALGLEHSADSADFMSATLQSGQRRLPSADELTLMRQLVAQIKASTTVAVNLSFDLIGFGNTAATMGSHVQVSDVRLLGLPQAADDSFVDTPIAITLVATSVYSTVTEWQLAFNTQSPTPQRVQPHKGSTHPPISKAYHGSFSI